MELLVALAITAMLLTATMVAIDASFKAYAASVETASAQTATRMVVNRLLMLIRTSSGEQGPLLLDSEPHPADDPVDPNWPVTQAVNDEDGNAILNTLDSKYIKWINRQGQLMRIEFRQGDDGAAGELWLGIDQNSDWILQDTEYQPLLDGVKDCHFFLHRRQDDDTGAWVLDRATIDLSVMPDKDNTLAIEGDHHGEIHVVASTMPRKLE